MKKTQIWIAFLACMALIALWFSFGSSYQVYLWATQTRSTSPLSLSWEIEQQASDRYALAATYTFLHEGKLIKGKTTFQTERYKSPETARHFLDRSKNQTWTIRYAPSRPQNSTINRYFPLKSCVYTAIVWCILFYFIWLVTNHGPISTNSHTHYPR